MTQVKTSKTIDILSAHRSNTDSHSETHVLTEEDEIDEQIETYIAF